MNATTTLHQIVFDAMADDVIANWQADDSCRWLANERHLDILSPKLCELVSPDEIEARRDNPNNWKGFDRAEAINPGDHYGETYLLWVEDCFDPPVFLIEANHLQEAQEIFLEEKPHMTLIDPEDLDDHKNEDGSEEDGTLWADHVEWTSHGAHDTESVNGTDQTEGWKYFGGNCPPWGISPEQYNDWNNAMEDGSRHGKLASTHRFMDFDPKDYDRINRVAYAMAYLTHSTNPKQNRKARLYLRIAGLPV